MVTIRLEALADAKAVRRVHELAFAPSTFEASLVDALRESDKVSLSLVADDDGEVVGHVLFSLMSVRPSAPSFRAVGLGPLAVLPERQGEGIGSQLARLGVAQCLRDGADCIFVLGSLAYYKRFGFEPVAGKGVTSTPDIPVAHLQVIEAWEGALGTQPVQVSYATEFSQAAPS